MARAATTTDAFNAVLDDVATARPLVASVPWADAFNPLSLSVDAQLRPDGVHATPESIAKLLGDDLTARDDGTLAAAVWCVDHGARLVRVHDVGAVADALGLLDVMDAIDAEAVA